MKIEARAVTRPFTISQLADYFNEDQAALLNRLAELAITGRIYAHDVEQVATDDYRVSPYATVMLFIGPSATVGAAMRLAQFFAKHPVRCPLAVLAADRVTAALQGQRLACLIKTKEAGQQQQKREAALDQLVAGLPVRGEG